MRVSIGPGASTQMRTPSPEHSDPMAAVNDRMYALLAK
jgi:hypothetical protein